MDLQAKLNNLKNEINCNIYFFSKKHKSTKRRSYTIKISSVTFSALITVFLGIASGSFETMLKNVSIVLGAVVTIINGIDAFYNYNGLWIKNTLTLSKLMELKREVEYFTAGCKTEDISEERLNKYMDELQQILKDDITNWLRIRERAHAGEQNKDNQGLISIKNRSAQEMQMLKFRQEKDLKNENINEVVNILSNETAGFEEYNFSEGVVKSEKDTEK